MSEIVAFDAVGVRSLAWTGGRLVDWAAGGIEYGLDGTTRGPWVELPACVDFDAACASPSGAFAAAYPRNGTRAMLWGPNGLARELVRDSDHADAYDYPICLFQLPGGREVLAHCPHNYFEIVIEDAETGEWLGTAGTRERDVFQSRLTVDRAGRHLVSAGWAWHPFEMAVAYDVEAALAGRAWELPEPWNAGCEVATAALTPAGRLVLAAARESQDFAPESTAPRLRPGTVAVYDLDRGELVSVADLEHEAGILMPVSEVHAVGFYGYPKLIDLATGRTLRRWVEFGTGTRCSSLSPVGDPPLALDPAGRRFAVAGAGRITVVTVPETW